MCARAPANHFLGRPSLPSPASPSLVSCARLQAWASQNSNQRGARAARRTRFLHPHLQSTRSTTNTTCSETAAMTALLDQLLHHAHVPRSRHEPGLAEPSQR